MVAKMVEEAKGQLPRVQLEEVVITEHPAIAVTYRVMSTPAIAINGRLEFVGVPRADALLARLQTIAADATDPRGWSQVPPTRT